MLTLAGVIDVQVDADGKLTMANLPRVRSRLPPPGRLRRIKVYRTTGLFTNYGIEQAKPKEASVGWFSNWRLEIVHLIATTEHGMQLTTLLAYMDLDGVGEARTLLSNTPEQHQRLIMRTTEEMLAAHNRGQV